MSENETPPEESLVHMIGIGANKLSNEEVLEEFELASDNVSEHQKKVFLIAYCGLPIGQTILSPRDRDELQRLVERAAVRLTELTAANTETQTIINLTKKLFSDQPGEVAF